MISENLKIYICFIRFPESGEFNRYHKNLRFWIMNSPSLCESIWPVFSHSIASLVYLVKDFV